MLHADVRALDIESLCISFVFTNMILIHMDAVSVLMRFHLLGGLLLISPSYFQTCPGLLRYGS